MKKLYLVLILLFLSFSISSCGNNEKEEIVGISLNLDYVEKEYIVGDEISYYGLQILVQYELDDECYYLDDYSNVSFKVLDKNENVVNGAFSEAGVYLVVVAMSNMVSSNYEVIVYNTISYSLIDALDIAYKENRLFFGDRLSDYWEPIDTNGVFYGLGSNIATKSETGTLRLQLQISSLNKPKISGLGIKVNGPCTISIPFITESPYAKTATLSIVEFIEVDGAIKPVLVEEVGKSESTAEYITLTYEYKGTAEKMLYFCSPLVRAAVADVVVTFYIK